MKAIEKQFSQWVDQTLSGDLPEGIAAFHFNLYDSPTSHELQIVGCPTYDPQDPDWACDDIFMSDDPHFELPHEVVEASGRRDLLLPGSCLAPTWPRKRQEPFGCASRKR